MTIRVRLACAAILLWIACPQVSFAQLVDSVTTPALVSAARPGRAAIGGQIGGNWIIGSPDYAKGAQPRFAFAGHFRYVMAPHWRWQFSPYMSWNAYRVGSRAPFQDPGDPSPGRRKDFYLTQLVGANAQLQWTRQHGATMWHLGAGPGVYRVVIQNHRYVVKDPVTLRLHQGAYPAATAEIGVEHFLQSLTTTSIEWTAAYHAAFAKRDEQFPSGFNGLVGAVELRLGVHYYYDFRKSGKPGAGHASK